MKKLYILLTTVILATSAMAQAPEKMSYQAVVRDAGNALVASQSVGMQISILQGSVSGAAVYVETQTPDTNINGLVSLQIGSGTVVSGTFNTIDWSNGPYFIKTETDPTGGTTYSITGTSQLMSVPYALHANTANSIAGEVSITETNPVFGVSIANGITAADTASWNNHTVDTNTQLDATGVSALGFVTGPHVVDNDTQLDSIGVSSLGFDAGPHIVDTDTQLDATGVAALGYVAGPHTVEIDGSVTNEIQNLMVSQTGDTLSINGGNFVLVSGISDLNYPPAIGDFREGGVVFWLDGSGGGLVCTVSDQSTGIQWYNGSHTTTGATATAIGTGQTNTTSIVANQGVGSYAAELCNNLSLNGFTDWYLPSDDELDEMYLNKVTIDATALANGGASFADNIYWSSTEVSSIHARTLYFFNSGYFNYNKSELFYVRAIRTF